MRGVPKLRGECKWSKHGIRYILTNERYMGDQRFRKSFRTNTLPYKKVDNRGQMPQFYMAGTHPAIIGQKVFEKAQTLLAQHGQQFWGTPLSSMTRPGPVCCTVLYAKRRSITARSTVGNAGSVPASEKQSKLHASCCCGNRPCGLLLCDD